MTCVNQDCTCNYSYCSKCGQFHSPYSSACPGFIFPEDYAKVYEQLKDKYPQPEIKVQKEEPGLKFDAGKPRMELLPQRALIEVSQVLTFGSKKYEAWNWAKGMSWTRLIGAALRHIAYWSTGETKDPETGLNHLSHAACDLLFLLEYQHFRQEFDDRYKVENKVDK
jgi:hypothetical protein